MVLKWERSGSRERLMHAASQGEPHPGVQEGAESLRWGTGSPPTPGWWNPLTCPSLPRLQCPLRP